MDKTFFEHFWEANALDKLGAIVGSVCVIWFLAARVYGSFRYRNPNPVRDMAFLFGPLAIAGMVSLIKAQVIGLYGGLESELRPILDYALYLCQFALCGFLLCLLALMLPQRKPPAQES